MSAPKRPNILVVMADQLTPPAMPFHGNSVVQAPAMSALADRGVVFDNAYTGSPLCAPARAALMTGLLPSRIGAYDNAADSDRGFPPSRTTSAASATGRCCAARCTSAGQINCTGSRSG